MIFLSVSNFRLFLIKKMKFRPHLFWISRKMAVVKWSLVIQLQPSQVLTEIREIEKTLKTQSKDISDIKAEITTIRSELNKSSHDVVLTRIGSISTRLGVLETAPRSVTLPFTLPTLTQHSGTSSLASDFL